MMLNLFLKSFIFSEVNKFLTVTLKSEKLSSGSQKAKIHVLEVLQKFYDDYPIFSPVHCDDGSTSSSQLAVPG